MNRVIAALAFTVVASTTAAQSVEVAPNVTSVQTVGRWNSAGKAGTYRIVVVQDGWEHAWSRVYVEWLPDPTNPEEGRLKPVLVEELRPPGVSQGTAMLEATAKVTGSTGISVTVTATSNMDPNARRMQFVFTVGAPGAIKLNPRAQER